MWAYEMNMQRNLEEKPDNLEHKSHLIRNVENIPSRFAVFKTLLMMTQKTSTNPTQIKAPTK